MNTHSPFAIFTPSILLSFPFHLPLSYFKGAEIGIKSSFMASRTVECTGGINLKISLQTFSRYGSLSIRVKRLAELSIDKPSLSLCSDDKETSSLRSRVWRSGCRERIQRHHESAREEESEPAKRKLLVWLHISSSVTNDVEGSVCERFALTRKETVVNSDSNAANLYSWSLTQ